MSYIVLFFKGILVGVGKIIPGVSGAIIAILLGIYEEGLKKINSLFKDFKNSLKFLFPIGLGVLTSMFFFSKIIVNSLNKYYLPTMLLFCGLIFGNLSENKIRINKNNIFTFIIIFIITILLSFLKQDNNSEYSFIMLIIMGLVEAISMIVPGLSGTALLMLFGYYNAIITSYNTLNMSVLIPFIIGLTVGILLISKIMIYLFENYKSKTETIIYALSISSVFTLLLETMKNNYNLKEITISLILLIIGYSITKMMEKLK